METKKFNLVEWLTDFLISIIDIAENLPNTRAGNYRAGQMIRSGTSPALHYGEAQEAESNQDFIHKIKVVLKELRETSIALLIIQKLKNFKDNETLAVAMDENNQLISIFVTTVKTAKKKNIKKEIITEFESHFVIRNSFS
ncbi:MAG TPA: four helix bundle protein [Bacteroidetes bacterium]|nr:four helix bundle protein [Bacteroidota bacterium]